MDPERPKTGGEEENPSSSSTGKTTGLIETSSKGEPKGRGEKRSLTSPAETGKGKVPNQKIDHDAEELLSDAQPGDISETDSIYETVNRIDGMTMASSVDGDIGGDLVNDRKEDIVTGDVEKASVCSPTKRQRVSVRPSFLFKVIAQQINLDGSPQRMSEGTYNKLDKALANEMYNTIMAGPSFQMATGTKHFRDGRLVIGCDNTETVSWLEQTIKSITFDGICFDIWAPTYKGVKMSFFVKEKDTFPRDQVLTLLQNQNNLLGKAFSVIRSNDTVSKDARTGEVLSGYIVTADVSKEFRDSALSKKKLYLMTQVISPQFPSSENHPKTNPATRGTLGGQGNSEKTRMREPKKIYTLETMPSEEVFWTKLSTGGRKFFRKWATTLGKPDLYPIRNPKRKKEETLVASTSSETGDVLGAQAGLGVPGPSDANQVRGLPSESSKVIPQVVTGDEFRKSQLEAKQKANLKKKDAATKTANPPKGVQSIQKYLCKK